MISFSHKGDFSKTEKFLTKAQKHTFAASLDKYGRMGVAALQKATPVDTGETAASWDYEIETSSNSVTIHWVNHHTAPTNSHVNIALILQLGHGTRNGGYVVGIDYINPAMRPVFDKIADDAWSEVNS